MSKRKILIAITISAIILISIFIFSPIKTTNNDFLIFLLGSKLYWQQQNPYNLEKIIELKKYYNLNIIEGQGYVYPLLLAFLLYPLTLLSINQAIFVWFIVNILIYSLVGYFLFAKIKFSNTKQFYIILIIYFLFPPFLGTLGTGQSNIIIFSLYVLFLYYLSKKNYLLSGIVIGFASAIKVYPILFVINQLIKKNLKFILVFAMSLLAFLSLPLSHHYKDFTTFYPKILFALQNDLDPFWTNQSLNAFLSRVFLDGKSSQAIINAPENIAKILIYICSSILIIYMLFLFWKHKDNPEKKWLIEMSWLTIILIIIGKSNFWTFIPLVIIYLYLILNWKLLTRWQKVITVVAILLNYCQLLTGIMIIKNLSFGKSGFIFSSMGFIGVFIIFVILCSLVITKKSRIKKFQNFL